MKEEGYIDDYAVTEATPQNSLEIVFKYGPRRERTITGLRRISKPGLRVYAKSDELPRVLGGLGVAVISTSSGMMTDRAGPQSGCGRRSRRLHLVAAGTRKERDSRVSNRQVTYPGPVWRRGQRSTARRSR